MESENIDFTWVEDSERLFKQNGGKEIEYIIINC